MCVNVLTAIILSSPGNHTVDQSFQISQNWYSCFLRQEPLLNAFFHAVIYSRARVDYVVVFPALIVTDGVSGSRECLFVLLPELL